MARVPASRDGKRKLSIPDKMEPGPSKDLASIARARAGDPEAFAYLVDEYSGRIYTHLYRLVRNREEAEDLTQDAFLRAFQNLSRFDGSRPFRNWLYTVATNVGLNALRSRRRRGWPVRLDAETEGYPLRGRLAARDEDGRQRAERGELRERLAVALKRLPARSALLMHLHYYEGMSIREAAEIAGLREGAAKVALHRARKSLREWLLEDEES